MNKAGCELFHTTLEEIIGKKCYETFKFNEACEGCRLPEVLAEKKPIRYERYVPEKDQWFDVRLHPILDDKGNVVNTIHRIHDITARKKAELEINDLREKLKSTVEEKMELDKSRKKYRDLFENALNPFAYHKIITDVNGNPVDYEFIFVNKAFEEYTDLSAKEIIGKTATEILPEIRNSNLIK